MINQLILRLKLLTTNFARHKIFGICRVNLLVNSQNRFCLHIESANFTSEFSLRRVNVRHVRIEIRFSAESFVAKLAVDVRFLHVDVLDVLAKAEDGGVAAVAVSAKVNEL